MAKIDMQHEILSSEELKFMKKHLAEWNNKRKQAGLDFNLSERIANVEMLTSKLEMLTSKLEMLTSKLEMKVEKEFIKVYILITVISISVAILCIVR